MFRSLKIIKVFLRVFVALILLGGVAGGLFFWVKYRTANATESSPLGAARCRASTGIGVRRMCCVCRPTTRPR